MSPPLKIRVSVILGILCLTAICLTALLVGSSVSWANEVAVGAVVGIAALLPKLVDSEEKGN